MKTSQPTWLIKLLIRLRDSRLVWDVMGSAYNRGIFDAVNELYDYIAGEFDIPEQGRILDAGTGPGYISLLLASRNPEVHITGMDYSLMQVREAEKFRRQRKIANCSFQQGNAMDMRFNDETFDAAVSIGSIKHWPDALRGLKEIRRVLKPGGQVVISETDQGASDEAVRQFIRRFQVWFIPDRLLFWGLRRVIFGQSFSEMTLADAVREAGFLQVEYHRVPTCPYVIVKARK
ncbi:MAG: class I SAM-dependent methyltransferase [Smithellaceae bacterium]